MYEANKAKVYPVFFVYGFNHIQLPNLQCMKTVYLSFLLLIHYTVYGQNTIRSDAQKMGKALVEKDYDTYVNYTYPKLMKDMGGREKMKETISKQMEDLEKQGIKILSVTYDEPSVIIKEKKELQATLPQHMQFESSNGKVTAQTTIIAVSQDDGMHWYFVDPGERDLETVRITLPNLSKKLVLPPAAPVKMEK